MINKKNVLGKEPSELGVKDAIHVAIVAVRAGCPLSPGERFKMNEYSEAVSAGRDGVGVIDPFRSKIVETGQPVWGLLDQDSVPNVRHDWDHPEVASWMPSRDVVKREEILEVARQYGVSYEQCLAAAKEVAYTFKPQPWPEGTQPRPVPGPQGRYNRRVHDYEFWSAFAEETGHVFRNDGSDCCPEWNYPECALFIDTAA